MSGPGRGGRGRPSMADYRSYDEYDDAYGAPRRPKPYYYQVERTQRPNTFDGQLPNYPRYRPYPDGANEHDVPPGLNQTAGPKPRYRASYATQPPRLGPEHLSAPLATLQQPPYSRSNSRRSGGNRRPPNSNGSTSSGWASPAGNNGHYNRPSAGGSGWGSGFRRQPSRDRQGPALQTSVDGSGGGSRGHSAGRLRSGSSWDRPLPGSASIGGSASGSVGGNNGHSNNKNNSNTVRTQEARGGGGASDCKSKARAPLFTMQSGQARSEDLGSQSSSTATVGDPQPELPNNPDFLTPSFPQPPRTRTDSCSTWALMCEAGCQSLEAVVGPFLEGLLMEVFGVAWERELYLLEVRLPPFTAAACVEVITKCKQLHDKLPITIHKRLEGVTKATADLEADPSALGPEDVTGADAAMKGVVQDCIKAMNLPSLLGTGSRQFVDFTTELLPHMASTLLYYDTLIVDCAEAAAAWHRARGEELTGLAAASADTPPGEGEGSSANITATTAAADDDDAGVVPSEATSGSAATESGTAA